MPLRPMSARVPATIPPSLIVASMPASVKITTSAGSLASRWRVTPAVPKASDTLWPVSFSNACASSVTMARTAPALSTLISAASARRRRAAAPIQATASSVAPSLRFVAPHHRQPPLSNGLLGYESA
jgi:hypothetical protein